MANIKVSELTEASSFDDGDYSMIVQANQNKKISHNNMLGTIKNDISTINSKINSIVDSEIYSTTEVLTNKKWIDGKPIYRKVLDLGSHGWDTNEHSFAHNVSDIDFVFEARWIGFIDNKWYYSWDKITPLNIITDSTNVTIHCNASLTTFTKNYIILEYTKTTD